MKVLIISANILPSSPSGPAYVAGAARRAGHTVEVFECLFAKDLVSEVEERVNRFKPDVIGVSLRIVTGSIVDEDTEFNTKFFDARPKIKEMVDRIKQISDAHIVLGGPGFNYFGRDWLVYLDLDYGIRGEAEFSFPLYLQRLAEGEDIYSVPGCIYRKNGGIHKVDRELIDNLDDTALPAYDLFDLDQYSEHRITPAIFTKRGCAFTCTYCPYYSLEGPRYRLKSPRRVVAEIEYVRRVKQPKMVTFCDNNFNVPHDHAEAICREIIKQKLDIAWGTGSLKPVGLTDEVCALFKDSGCGYINLSVETASEKMLKQMRRGDTVEQIRNSLTCLSKSGIPFGISLMFGALGETPETIAETLDLVDEFEIPQGVWVTIGICLWTDRQQVLDDARQDGQLKNDADDKHPEELFEGATYMSPELPKTYMVELIESLGKRENYTVQVNKPYAEYRRIPV